MSDAAEPPPAWEAPWLAAGVSYQRKFRSARGAAEEDEGELTVDGVPCTELVCWSFISRKAGPCACEGRLAHILPGSCGRSVNLGFRRTGAKACGLGPRCPAVIHPSAAECRDALAAWWRETRGTEPTFGRRAAPTPINTAARGERSLASATGASEEGRRRCTLPASKVIEHLTRHEADSRYLAEFLRADYLQEMSAAGAARTLERRAPQGAVLGRARRDYAAGTLARERRHPVRRLADERLRALLAMRSRVKELSEACSVCEQVRALVGADTVAAGGEGAVVLDVCSGKGLGATLLSYMLPKGRVVMLDANGEMELAHVAARPNLSFRHADIFSAQLPAVVREEAAGAAVCVAVGMHLCGPLSPRLIDLTFAIERIDALLLCPCCLKGAHGKAVAASAKERGCDPYALLVETLRAICEREMASYASAEPPAAGEEGAPQLTVVTDGAMLSPRNVFLAVRKRRAPEAGGLHYNPQCEPCEHDHES